MTPLEHTIKIANDLGDPRPEHCGGPDSEAMIAWHNRWRRVVRALKLGQAAARLHSDVDSWSHAHGVREFEDALDSYRHHCMMLDLDK